MVPYEPGLAKNPSSRIYLEISNYTIRTLFLNTHSKVWVFYIDGRWLRSVVICEYEFVCTIFGVPMELMFKKLKVILVKPSKTFDGLQYTEIPTYVTLWWLHRQRYFSRHLKNCKAKTPRINLTGRHWHPNSSFVSNSSTSTVIKIDDEFFPTIIITPVPRKKCT